MVHQLKTNVNSVSTALNGGAHGYVGTIMYPVTYTTLAPLTPFAIPTPVKPCGRREPVRHFQRPNDTGRAPAHLSVVPIGTEGFKSKKY